MWTKTQMDVVVEQQGEPEPVEYDLVQELRINTDSIENLVEELKTQEQKALFWGGLAIKEAERFAKFEDVDIKQWRAHCNKYVKWIMKGRKDSITIQGMSEVVSEVYSDAIMDNEDLKINYAVEVVLAMLSKAEVEKLRMDGKWENKVLEIKDQMYRYGQSYESVMNMYHEMEADKKLLALVADAFKARGYSLSNVKQVTVGLEGEGFQVPRKTVDALESIAKKLETIANKK